MARIVFKTTLPLSGQSPPLHIQKSKFLYRRCDVPPFYSSFFGFAITAGPLEEPEELSPEKRIFSFSASNSLSHFPGRSNNFVVTGTSLAKNRLICDFEPRLDHLALGRPPLLAMR